MFNITYYIEILSYFQSHGILYIPNYLAKTHNLLGFTLLFWSIFSLSRKNNTVIKSMLIVTSVCNILTIKEGCFFLCCS